MAITADQRRVIDAIVSIHETGKVPSASAYSTVTVLTDGAGISYGKHQSTDKSDSLDAIVLRYLDLGGALADKMRPYLADLDKDFSATVDPKNPPTRVKELMALLADAGKEPTMQRAQDEVFDERYWTPAAQRCAAMKLVTGLAHLAVYDTCIHSGPGRVDSLRKNFPERPPASGGDEKAWVDAFLQARWVWLTSYTHSDSNRQALVRRTARRVETIRALGASGNWDLVPPTVYRGITLT